MHLPDWVTDDVLAAADCSSIRVLLALFRHGTAVTAGDGSRRMFWRGTRTELARITRQSRRASDLALALLAERQVVSLHQTTVRPATLSFSCPEKAPRMHPGSNRAEPAVAPIHDGDEQTILALSEEDDCTTTMSRAELLERLETEGVTSPAAWLSNFGEKRVTSALRRLDEQNRRDEAAASPVEHYGDSGAVQYSITNPPGFLYRLLERRR